MPSTPRPFGNYEFLWRFALSGGSKMWRARSRQHMGDEPTVLIKRKI